MHIFLPTHFPCHFYWILSFFGLPFGYVEAAIFQIATLKASIAEGSHHHTKRRGNGAQLPRLTLNIACGLDCGFRFW